jgi:PKHD-type hydroxylase
MLVPTGNGRYHSHVVVRRAFTAGECRTIVDLGRRLSDADAALADGAGDAADPGLRQARVAWVGADEDTEWIFERLATYAARANQTYGFDLAGFTEDLQFTTYDRPGSFYTWHQDGLDGAVADRKLSLVVQLSDPASYEGSDLELLDVAEDYSDDDRAAWRTRARRRGTVIAFPAFEYHRVTPLISGTRHSLVCWIGGPPFR